MRRYLDRFGFPQPTKKLGKNNQSIPDQKYSCKINLSTYIDFFFVFQGTAIGESPMHDTKVFVHKIILYFY